MDPNPIRQRSPSGRSSGLSKHLIRSVRSATRLRPSGVSAGIFPSGGSTISEVRMVPSTTANLSPRSKNKIIVRVGDVRLRRAASPVDVEGCNGVLLKRRRFGLRQHRLIGQRHGTLERSQRRVGPDSLQIRMTVGGARSGPCLPCGRLPEHRRRDDQRQSSDQGWKSMDHLFERPLLLRFFFCISRTSDLRQTRRT